MKIIGIDPAFRKNGFCAAIMNLDNLEVEFKIFKNSYIDFIFWLFEIKNNEDCNENLIFAVENSNLQKKCWNKNPISVGKNQAISQITSDIIKVLFNKSKLYEFSPLNKGNKIINEKVFKQLSINWKLINYKGLKTEQDKRDAFKICILTLNISDKLCY